MTKRFGFYEDTGAGVPTTGDPGSGGTSSGDMGDFSDPAMPPQDPMPTEPELFE